MVVVKKPGVVELAVKLGLRLSESECVGFPDAVTQIPRAVRKFMMDGMQAAHEHIWKELSIGVTYLTSKGRYTSVKPPERHFCSAVVSLLLAAETTQVIVPERPIQAGRLQVGGICSRARRFLSSSRLVSWYGVGIRQGDEIVRVKLSFPCSCPLCEAMALDVKPQARRAASLMRMLNVTLLN